MTRLPLAAALAFVLAGCAAAPANPPAAAGGVTATTAARQSAVASSLDLADPRSFDAARRGLVAKPSGQVRDETGRVVWDYDGFAFVQGNAPATVNPSLWRQAKLNNEAGLFKVTEGVWQLRGFDLANLTLIQGRTGWIVVDPLTTRETAAAALAFARQHLGDRPVSAVVYTHSHVDHFGGVLGVLTAEDAAARKVPVVAPVGFMEEATSENLLVGTAMSRRAGYMYGGLLPRRADGAVDTGLGKAVAAGRVGILPPTVVVDQPHQAMTLDGVKFVFHNAPGTEAPAEMTFTLPDLRAFGAAELVSQTLHNLYTLRGAKVRDSLAWAKYIDEALGYLGDSDVMFLQHGWPVWGRDDVIAFLKTQRDTYRYLHDQTVRMINAGLTGPEIAEAMVLPKSLETAWSSRGYYGTVRHNTRAIYQHYMGWFDANPANLDPLPPVDAAKKYVALAGGADAAVAAAQKAFDAGDYRWAAELLKHVVLADATNTGARELQAKAFEQLGYVAESAPWRNFYLSGAKELREGPPPPALARGVPVDLLRQIPIDTFLDAMSARLNGPRADGVDLRVDLRFSDLGQTHGLWIENAVLHHRPQAVEGKADATLTLTHDLFLRLATGRATAGELVASKDARIEGNPLALAKLFGLLDKTPGNFPIVTR
jgi:alkyl sulfatase BDS1-like metallo-beta-lactamase superfamily hydrolase